MRNTIYQTEIPDYAFEVKCCVMLLIYLSVVCDEHHRQDIHYSMIQCEESHGNYGMRIM